MSKIYERKLPIGRFCTYLNLSEFDNKSESIQSVNQVHGNELVKFEHGDEIRENISTADGLVYIHEKYNQISARLPIFKINTADCLPIVLIGENGFAQIHAGWRGLHRSHLPSILDHDYLKIIKPYYAFIGPSIHACCFEVSREFRDYFPQSEDCFKLTESGNIYFDLQKEAILQMTRLFSGSHGEKFTIEDSSVCTFCSPLAFNSYRLNKTALRNINLLLMN